QPALLPFPSRGVETSAQHARCWRRLWQETTIDVTRGEEPELLATEGNVPACNRPVTPINAPPSGPACGPSPPLPSPAAEGPNVPPRRAMSRLANQAVTPPRTARAVAIR